MGSRKKVTDRQEESIKPDTETIQILEQADQDVRITIIGVLKEIKEKMNEMDKRWRNIRENYLKKTPNTKLANPQISHLVKEIIEP